MQRWISIMLFCGLFPGTASAQPVTVQFGPPAIRWEARPRTVVIAPGVWVVEDSPDEVFYYDQWYWTQQNGHWYRSRDHQGHWGEVERGRVPGRLYAQEPGHYRHFRGEGRHGHGHVRPEGRHPGPSAQDYKHPGASPQDYKHHGPGPADQKKPGPPPPGPSSKKKGGPQDQKGGSQDQKGGQDRKGGQDHK